MIVCGDVSGEIYGAELARELKNRHPSIRIHGMGGEMLRRAGVEILTTISPVVGLMEIAGHLGAILNSLNTLKEHLRRARPDLLILIDSPEFNLRLAPVARKLGVKVMYYVSPQVWAWRRGRIKTIVRDTDAMAVILPFEKELYASRGLRTEYIGHPMVEQFVRHFGPDWARTVAEADRTEDLLALLPGSRRSEVSLHVPLLERVVKRLCAERPFLHIVVPIAPNLPAESRGLLRRLESAGAELTEQKSWDLFRRARVALVASGTSSLESALLGVPTVVFYRLNLLSHVVAKMLVHVRYASLVNLILGREVIPEFLQYRATPENLCRGVLDLDSDRDLRTRVLSAYREVRNLLSASSATKRAADLAGEVAGW